MLATSTCSVLLVASFLFWFFARFFSRQTINRAEGALLAAGYVAYIIYLVG